MTPNQPLIRVFEYTYRCGCGGLFVKHLPEGLPLKPLEETPIESSCCTHRKALLIRIDQVVDPSWELVSKVYRL